MLQQETTPTAESKKLTFEIVRHPSPTNPFTDWDFEPALMYSSGRHAGRTDYSEGSILEAIQQAAIDGKIIRHQKKILSILELSSDYYEGYCKEEKIDFIRNEINRATIEELGELCELFKLPYKQYTSTGYSQGDWAEVLIVLTPEFYERTGAPKKHDQKNLEGAANLFDSWAWGDVYGFRIYKETTCECCNETKKEEIDSCYSFFGDDFEENGMMDYFPEELKEKLKNFDTCDIKY
jgi:hypothetical protein